MIVLKLALTETQAFELAEDSDVGKKAKAEKKLVLSSASTTLDPEVDLIDSWNVNYIDKKTDELMSVTIKKEGVVSSEVSKRASDRKPVNVEKTPKYGAKKAFDIASKQKEKDFLYTILKVFITYYHSGTVNKDMWNIAFMAKNLTVYIVKVDATDGKVLETRKQKLIG